MSNDRFARENARAHFMSRIKWAAAAWPAGVRSRGRPYLPYVLARIYICKCQNSTRWLKTTGPGRGCRIVVFGLRSSDSVSGTGRATIDMERARDWSVSGFPRQETGNHPTLYVRGWLLTVYRRAGAGTRELYCLLQL